MLTNGLIFHNMKALIFTHETSHMLLIFTHAARTFFESCGEGLVDRKSICPISGSRKCHHAHIQTAGFSTSHENVCFTAQTSPSLSGHHIPFPPCAPLPGLLQNPIKYPRPFQHMHATTIRLHRNHPDIQDTKVRFWPSVRANKGCSIMKKLDSFKTEPDSSQPHNFKSNVMRKQTAIAPHIPHCLSLSSPCLANGGLLQRSPAHQHHRPVKAQLHT